MRQPARGHCGRHCDSVVSGNPARGKFCPHCGAGDSELAVSAIVRADDDGVIGYVGNASCENCHWKGYVSALSDTRHGQLTFDHINNYEREDY